MTVRVTDLHYVAHAVPDLAAERKFYGETWGLTEVGEEDGKIYFAAEGSPHPFVIRLRQDDEKKTDLIGFSAASKADVDAVFAQAVAAGAKPISEPGPAEGPAGGYAARFFDPEGRAIEVICDTKQRVHRTLARGEAIPIGLSHIVLHSPNHKALLKFYEDAMGFRVSDWIGEFMVFLRCNAAHHRLAIMPGPPALNHVAFDVNGVDELMRGLARLTQAGVTLNWGPGRHTAGNNTFSYYITPNGTAVEYTSDLEDVDEATWEAKTYEMKPGIVDQWGTGRIIPGNVPHVTADADKGLWCVPA
ncbi:2,3-dihydroxy-p-cumate/2,3-dihydroxybenzoate 3,4-dioxygenase [Sphingomonas vulcanisoli]|uniref:2,3-dihydroxy-p-cumate/2,3-dihydroxybenzoate 3,4-dioxygenase n=1 Tax=Sphingomonas vulcanisoli TaxID=1658060 RepID=A0ABX0TQE2_9SPHN|nr:VOC family protein [Sphingomonas vulcanisoli]NIJ07308.1 2,3-dihydroxy-p-cumate/2,3-dihydroxybenzoate 3,4-dioxygenase [Sphingomonas vulcanisoli]